MSEEPVDAVTGGSAPSKQVGRFTVPDFLMDLGREPGALAALVAGGLAVFVASLDPKVFGPGMPDMQRAVRERPALENLFLLAVVVQAGFYLVGGAAGDILGSRRVLLAGPLTRRPCWPTSPATCRPSAPPPSVRSSTPWTPP